MTHQIQTRPLEFSLVKNLDNEAYSLAYDGHKRGANGEMSCVEVVVLDYHETQVFNERCQKLEAK